MIKIHKEINLQKPLIAEAFFINEISLMYFQVF